MRRSRGNPRVYPLSKFLKPEALPKSQRAILRVIGMYCSECAERVRNSLRSRRGVVHVQVDPVAGVALLSYDAEQLAPHALKRAVASAGSGFHSYRVIWSAWVTDC